MYTPVGLYWMCLTGRVQKIRIPGGPHRLVTATKKFGSKCSVDPSPGSPSLYQANPFDTSGTLPVLFFALPPHVTSPPQNLPAWPSRSIKNWSRQRTTVRLIHQLLIRSFGDVLRTRKLIHFDDTLNVITRTIFARHDDKYPWGIRKGRESL